MKSLRILLLLYTFNVHADTNYLVNQVTTLPVIDGIANDTVWQQADELGVMDVVAKHEIYFSALHDGNAIAIKIRYPDATENREHKTLLWDDSNASYTTGPKREDTIVLKWAMNPLTEDLTLNSDTSYQADIWYWKSFRTDPTGHADDKYQIYTKSPNNKAKRLRSKDGSLFFLQRKGDAGVSSYKTRILIDKQNNQEDKYLHRQPQGSRADIKAKGTWKDGMWTVEFLRKLDTGQNDDVRLSTEGSTLFGLSRYEIAGRKSDPDLEIPLFGSGDVGELIHLRLKK